MRHHKNKEFSYSNNDYLTFITKNHELLSELKQLSSITKRTNTKIKSLHNTSTYQTKHNIQQQRYVSPLHMFQDNTIRSQQKVRTFSNSLDLQPTNNNQVKAILKSRKICGKNEPIDNIQQPFLHPRNTNQQLLHPGSSQILSPKLPHHTKSQTSSQSKISTHSKLYQSKHSHSNSQSIFTKNPQQKLLMQPLSLQPNKYPTQFFSDRKIPKPHPQSKPKPTTTKQKTHHKIVHSHQQNTFEIYHKKSTELTPIFRHIYTHRKQKFQVFKNMKQLALEKFLQANMIQQIRRKVVHHSTIATKDNSLVAKNKSVYQRQSMHQCQKNDLKLPENKKLVTFPKSFQVSISPTKIKSKPRQPKSNTKTHQLTIYDTKIASYRQFLFAINFSHRVFDPLVLKDDLQMHKNNQLKYKYFLGLGNNKLLVQSLMKRRFWWTQIDQPHQANFVWTQLKINYCYQTQSKSNITDRYDKNDDVCKDYLKKQRKTIKTKIDSLKAKQQKDKIGSILRGPLPKSQKRIFTSTDNNYFQQLTTKLSKENHTVPTNAHHQHLFKYLPEQFLKKREENYHQLHMQNHFIYNFEIGNKKALFYHIKHYYQLRGVNPYNTIPLTFHIKKGVSDPQYAKFIKQYRRVKNQVDKSDNKNSQKRKLSKNVWIVKPGQLSNRGNGITVIDEIYQLSNILKKKVKHPNGNEKTYIVQKYIEKPMLYKNRKFDIRHYMMISRLHGRLRAYWFSEGYIRTSSYQFNLEQINNTMIHLTNDAIQKYGSSYGKYEQGNKISYAQFQRYLDVALPQKKYSFIESVYPRMKQIATDAIKATYLWMDPDHLQHNFEIFGLDFMIDDNFNTWLIEVNTNPCLELSSVLLGRIIPTMLQHTLRLTLDSIFPPTAHYINSNKYLAPNSPMDRLQFQLIFDEGRDGKEIEQLFSKYGKADCGKIEEEDEIYDNDGKQIQLGCDLE